MSTHNKYIKRSFWYSLGLASAFLLCIGTWQFLRSYNRALLTLLIIGRQVIALRETSYLSGLASSPQDAQPCDTLIDASDQAMYVAKRLRRNQIHQANDQDVQTLLTKHTNSKGGREEVAMQETVQGLLTLIAIWDADSHAHAQLVGDLSQQLALALGLSSTEATMIALAGHLHDIGKMALPDALLSKPSALTTEEQHILQTHPTIGAEVMNCIPLLRPIGSLIHAHHERWDGQGYPSQLVGRAIPFGARIIAVADAYTVMTTGRSYQQARPSSEALEELRRCSGTQFDPKVVSILITLLTTTTQFSESLA